MAREPVAIAEPVAVVEDRILPDPTSLRVRIYRPNEDAALPLIVYNHGGGWVLGNLEMQDETCRRLANRVPAVVVNVEYRLAPEHPYPAASDDCVMALKWAHENAASLGGDTEKLIVAGTSAGGNLAASAALRTRDTEGPPLALQVLLLPVVDDRMDTPSYRMYRNGPVLEARQMQWYWDQYVPDLTRRSEPYAAPARTADLSGLPTTIVVTAGCDPLRDEAEDYAQRLRNAGVQVTARRFPGQVHGFMRLFGVLSDADRALDLVASDIRASLDAG